MFRRRGWRQPEEDRHDHEERRDAEEERAPDGGGARGRDAGDHEARAAEHRRANRCHIAFFSVGSEKIFQARDQRESGKAWTYYHLFLLAPIHTKGERKKMRSTLAIAVFAFTGALLGSVVLRETHATRCHSKVAAGIWEEAQELPPDKTYEFVFTGDTIALNAAAAAATRATTTGILYSEWSDGSACRRDWISPWMEVHVYWFAMLSPIASPAPLPPPPPSPPPPSPPPPPLSPPSPPLPSLHQAVGRRNRMSYVMHVHN